MNRRLVSVESALVCTVIDAFVAVSALAMETDAEDTELPRADISVTNVEAVTELVDTNADTNTLIELESDEIEVLRLVASSDNAMEYWVVVNCAVSDALANDCESDDTAAPRLLVSVDKAVESEASVAANAEDCNGTMD